jgi:cysteine-rich repeat protein
MYSNAGICQPCNTMAGCIDCNTGGCTLCDSIFGFLLNSSGKCVCDYGFFINAMNICEQCKAQGCVNCLSQTQCIECDTSLYYLAANVTCDDTCGDGFKIYVECDDGNLVNGDGCSNQCKVETDYTCTGGSITTKDTCSYSGPINLTITRTLKDQRQNRVFIEIIISPNLQSLTGIDFSVAINPTFPFKTKTATFDTNKSLINF